MNHKFEPLDQETWIQGDYRYGATISAKKHSIESLAKLAGATLNHFREDGLGPGRSFGLRLSTGRQVAFEQYENGAAEVSLIVRFEDGSCSAPEIWQALELFHVHRSEVTWVASEAK